MSIREYIIRKWFGIWLTAEDTGITDIFTEDAVYIKNWGPEYHGAAAIWHWYAEWNTRGKVLRWDSRQFFYDGNQTVLEWCFENAMNNGTADAFDGMSLVRWTAGERMCTCRNSGATETGMIPMQKGIRCGFGMRRQSVFRRSGDEDHSDHRRR